MTDVELPVYFYDVITTDAKAPRLVVPCRSASAAQDLANRLNHLKKEGVLAGDEEFTADEPRVDKMTLTIQPGDSIAVQGYAVATEEVARKLNDAKDAQDAKQFAPLPALTPLPAGT